MVNPSNKNSAIVTKCFPEYFPKYYKYVYEIEQIKYFESFGHSLILNNDASIENV